MGTSQLHLMAFEPLADIETEIYTVSLPPALREALFKLKPPKRERDFLATNDLKAELTCWLDQVVSFSPIRRDDEQKPWLISLEPVDLERLCNLIANWLCCTCDEQIRATPLFDEAIRLLRPELFSEYTGHDRLNLFDKNGAPTCNLAFSAFSAQVASALVGTPLFLPSGACLKFNRLPGGTDNDYQLMSDVRFFEECPYAIILHFHVETLPVNRKARLCVHVKVRRFIHDKWTDKPFPYLGGSAVQALIRTGNGAFKVVPYRYSCRTGQLEWDPLAKRNYEGTGLVELPDLKDYFSNMASFAQEGHSPQILSPYSLSSTWASNIKVATGVSTLDKSDIFNRLIDALHEYVRPVEPISSSRLANLKTMFDEPKDKMWDEQPEQAEALHAPWAKANRRRLADCTGERRIAFELIGNAGSTAILDLVKKQIEYFLGEPGCFDGVDISIKKSRQDALLKPLQTPGNQGTETRWRNVEATLGKAQCLTACIVALPDASGFSRDGEDDPKTALRMGLARSGRLSQFIVPEMNASAKHRARAAVRDLMRQLGFMPEFQASRKSVDLSIPTIGLYVYNPPRKAASSPFPLAVRYEPTSGNVTVDCPLFKERRLPYWKAELELACLSTSKESKRPVGRANGHELKTMIDRFKYEATEETLLLVESYGLVRRKQWWPGLTDESIAHGELRYGPTRTGKYGEVKCSDEPFDLEGSQLNILRVRIGAHGEVPDYYTDEKPETEQGRACYCKQGLFLLDGYALALTAKPNATDYNLSLVTSKFDRPRQRYVEKALNEYCLLTSTDREKLAQYAKYAEALRGNMVQLAKSDMRIDLPAPLHLAACLEEYIWAAKQNKR